MKKLNQNNTIATTAMLTKTNTMKNKMNLFAKVFMLVVMMVMLVPNVAWGQQPWTKNGDIWYILNVSNETVCDGTAHAGKNTGTIQWNVYVPTNTNATGTFCAYTEKNATNSYQNKFYGGTGSTLIIDLNVPDHTTSGNCTTSVVTKGTTIIKSAVESSGGVTKRKKCDVSIPVPVHCDPKTFSNKTLPDVSVLESGASSSITINTSDLFTSFLTSTSGNITFEISEVDGDDAAGSKTFYISNETNEMTVPYQLCGANAAFQPTDAHGVPTSITFHFKPKSAGTKTATVTVYKDGGEVGRFTLTGECTKGTPEITWVAPEYRYLNVEEIVDQPASTNSTGAITFKSQNTAAIVALDNNGNTVEWGTRLKAIAPGPAMIQAHITETSTYTEGNFQEQFEVSNKTAQIILWTQTDINNISIQRESTATFTLTAAAYERDNPTIPTGKSISYTSSDPSIASINSATNELTAHKKGTVTITATVEGDNDYLGATTSRVIFIRIIGDQCSQYSVEYIENLKSNQTIYLNGLGDELSVEVHWDWMATFNGLKITDSNGKELGSWSVTIANPFENGHNETHTYSLDYGVTSLTFSGIGDNRWFRKISVTQKTYFTPENKNSMDFGNVTTNNQSANPQTFYIDYSNLTDPIDVTLSGGANSNFTIDNDFVNVGCYDYGRANFNIKFAPKSKGPHTETITFTSKIGNAPQTHTITVTGNGTGQQQSLSWQNPSTFFANLNALTTVKDGNIDLTFAAESSAYDIDQTLIAEYELFDLSTPNMVEIVNSDGKQYLKINKAGTFKIRAKQIGNDTYDAAQTIEYGPITVSLVTPNLTITGNTTPEVFSTFPVSASSTGTTPKGYNGASDGKITFSIASTYDNQPTASITDYVEASKTCSVTVTTRGTIEGIPTQVVAHLAATDIYEATTETLTVNATKVTPNLSSTISSLNKTALTNLDFTEMPVTITNSTDVWHDIAVTYSSGDPAIALLDDDHFQLLKSGKCTITAKVDAGPNNNVSSNTIQITLNVERASQNITWNPQTNLKVGNHVDRNATAGTSITYESGNTNIISADGQCLKAGVTTYKAMAEETEVYYSAESEKSFKVDFADDFVLNCSTAVIGTPSTTTLDMSGYFVPSGNYTAAVTPGSEFSVTGVSGNNITIQFDPTSVNINSDTEEKVATIQITDNDQTYSFKVKAIAEKLDAVLVLDAIGNPDPYVFSNIAPTLSTKTTDAANVTYTYKNTGGTTLGTGTPFKLPSIAPVKVTATTPATTVYKAGTSNTITVNPQRVTPTITFGTITGTAHAGTNFALNGADWASATKTPAQPARSEWTNEQVNIVYTTNLGTVTNNRLSSTKAGYATITAHIYEAGNHTAADYEPTSGLKIDFATNFALQFTGGNVTVGETQSQTFDMADNFVPDGSYTVAVTSGSGEFSVSSDPISDNKITVTFAPTSVNNGNNNTQQKTCTLQITNNGQVYTLMVRATAEKRDAGLTISYTGETFAFSTITLSDTKETTANVTYSANGTPITGSTYKIPSTAPVTITATTPATTTHKAGTSNTITINPKRVTPKVTNTNWSGNYPDQNVGTSCAIGQADWDVDETISGQPAKSEWADGEVTITYTSSNSNIAEVNGSNLVFHKAGLATITASIPEEKNHNASTNSPTRLVKVDFSDDAVDCGAAYVGESPATYDVTDMIILPETGTMTATSGNTEFSVDLSDEKIVIAYNPTYFPSSDGVNSGVITFTYKDNENNEYEFHLNVRGTCLRKTPTIVWIDNKALKKNDTQENRQIVELLKSYSYVDGGVTISSSNTSVIKVYKADGTEAGDNEAGITFWAYGVGTATLTITIPATDIHEGLTASAEFAVTDKEICMIVWDQEELLKNLYVGDEFELIAHVVNENGEEISEATISYAIIGTIGKVTLSNTDDIWKLTAVAETDESTPVQLTATADMQNVDNGEDYFVLPVTYNVIVKAPNTDGCLVYIYEHTGNMDDGSYYFEQKNGQYYPVGGISFDYRSFNEHEITITEILPSGSTETQNTKSYTSGEWSTSSGTEPTQNDPFTLHRDAIGITITGSNIQIWDNISSYFSNVKVTQASYFEYGTTTEYDFGSCQTSVPKQMLIRNVAKYSNLNEPVRAIITSGNKYFKVVDSDQNHLGTGCGDFGDVAVMVEYMADDDNVPHEGTLKLVGYIGTTREEVTIDLTGKSKNTVQKISWPVGFEDGATIIASEGTIDLSGIGSVTTKGATGGAVSFTISPDASISDGNILTFTTDGYYELTATAEEITIDDEDYDVVSETHTFYLTQGGSCGEYCFNQTIESTGTYTFFPSTSVPDKLIGTLIYTGIGILDANYTIQDNNRKQISTGSGRQGNIEEYTFSGTETGIRVTTLTRCSLAVQVTQKTDKQLKYSGAEITSGSTIDFGGQLIGEESKPKEVEIEYWNMPFMNAELIGNDDNHFRLEQVVDGMAKCNCHGTTKYRIYFTPSSIDEVVTCTLKLTYSTDVNNNPPLTLILSGYGKRLDPGLYQIKSLPDGLKALDIISLEGYAGVNPRNTEQTVKYVALSSQTGTELSDVAEVVDNTDGTQSLKILKPGDFYLMAYVEQSNTYTSASFVFPVYHAGKAIRTVAWGDNTSSLTVASPDTLLDAYTINKFSTRIADDVAGTVTYSIESASEIAGKSLNCVELDSEDNTKLVINGVGTATLKAVFSGSDMYEDVSATWDITIANETLTIAVTDAAEITITSTDKDVDMWEYLSVSNFTDETIKKSVSQPSGLDGVLTIADDNQYMTVMKEAATETVQVPCTLTVTSRYLADGSNPTATGNITFSISKGTLIFNVAGKWTDKENWSRGDIVETHTNVDNGVSDLSEYNVLINGSCFIGKDPTPEDIEPDESEWKTHKVAAACNNLTIDGTDAKLVIGEASTLNVVGNLNNTDASKLVLTANQWGQASVVFGNTSNNPMATVEMFLPEGNGSSVDPVWQYRGICVEGFSPITTAQVVDEDGNLTERTANPWANVHVFEWDESQNNDTKGQGCWAKEFRGADITDNSLKPWKGYCFANMAKSPVWLSYTGTLIKGDKNIDLSYHYYEYETDKPFANVGNNLITNSFTVPLIINKLVYPEDKCDKQIVLYNAGSYAQYKKEGGEAGNQRGNAGQFSTVPQQTGEPATGIITIPAGQSFFVKTDKANNTLSIQYGQDYYDLAPSGMMYMPKRDAEPEFNILKINVVAKSDSASDQVALLECETCTRQYDNGYDGRKKFGDSGLPQIYAYNKFGNTAVNADSTLNKQYVGFMAGSDDETYTISFETDKLFGYHSLYLTDRKLNETVDILAGETYQFKGYTVGENMRFQINGVTEREWEENKNDDDNDDDDSNVCDLRVVGNTLYVEGFTTDHYPAARVELFDMTGNLVWSTPLTSERIYDLPQLPQGIYMIRLGDCHVKYIKK